MPDCGHRSPEVDVQDGRILLRLIQSPRMIASKQVEECIPHSGDVPRAKL